MLYWRRKQRGFYLIVSLWISLLLTLFCLGLGFQTYLETRKSRLLIARWRSYQAARAGIQAARALLADDKDLPDHLGELWARPFSHEIIFQEPLQKASFSVVISDESSRCNINKVSPDLMKKIFKQRGIENYEDIVSALLLYSGKISKTPSEKSAAGYKARTFVCLPEILLIEPIDQEAYRAVADLITVYGDQRLNINTAGEDLLTAFIDDSAIRQTVLRRRFISRPGYFREAGEIPPPLAQTFKTVSDIYRIVSVGQAGEVCSQITCVYDRRRKNFLYWHES